MQTLMFVCLRCKANRGSRDEDVFALRYRKEIVEFVGIDPQERILEMRTDRVDVPSPQVVEQLIEVHKIGGQERILQGILVHNVDVSVPTGAE